ncbi:MAG: trypsin-like peptidase domain-containing protein [Candidatus Saccharibacteria bacterium]
MSEETKTVTFHEDDAPEQVRQPLHRPEKPAHGTGYYLAISLIGGLVGSYLFVHDFASIIPISKRQIVVQESSAVVDVAKKVSPSVVSITSQAVTTSFFGTSQTSEGQGTGIILTSDGLIMTNNHVISGSSNLTVFTSNGKQYPATIVATDANNDYAFIRIKATGLPAAKLGNSSNVQIGQRVVAIGNALGQFQNTVTDGIISGKGRPITASDSGTGEGAEQLQNLFQTDAAINPGNSGGPLVDLDGNVIGMNTAVAGNAQNIGFAIPIDEIKSAISSVEKQGKIEKPYLGVRYIQITPVFAKANNLSVTTGALLISDGANLAVLANSPAAKAGLKEGDIVSKIAGQQVDQDHTLTSLLSKKHVGDKVKIEYLRDGKSTTVEITLELSPTS